MVKKRGTNTRDDSAESEVEHLHDGARLTRSGEKASSSDEADRAGGQKEGARAQRANQNDEKPKRTTGGKCQGAPGKAR